MNVKTPSSDPVASPEDAVSEARPEEASRIWEFAGLWAEATHQRDVQLSTKNSTESQRVTNARVWPRIHQMPEHEGWELGSQGLGGRDNPDLLRV